MINPRTELKKFKRQFRIAHILYPLQEVKFSFSEYGMEIIFLVIWDEQFNWTLDKQTVWRCFHDNDYRLKNIRYIFRRLDEFLQTRRKRV